MLTPLEYVKIVIIEQKKALLLTS